MARMYIFFSRLLTSRFGVGIGVNFEGKFGIWSDMKTTRAVEKLRPCPISSRIEQRRRTHI